MAQTMSELLPCFTDLLFHGNKNAISDTVMAAQSAIACIHASIINARSDGVTLTMKFDEYEMKDTFRTWEDAVSAIDAVLTYQAHL